MANQEAHVILEIDPLSLETERLRLELPRPEHAAGTFESYSSDPEVTRYLRWKPARTIADSVVAMAARLGRMERLLRQIPEWFR